MATGGSSQSKLSEETFDIICTACDKDNRTLEAVRYCVECLGYCCQECTDLHSRFPTLKNHNLLDVGQGDQASKKPPKLPEFPIERCNIHEGKVLDMYCEHHDVVGCSTCISKDHRACPDNNIQFIPEMIDSLFNLTRTEQVQINLKNLMVSITKRGSSKDDQLAMLRDSKDETLEKIAKFQKALETVVKKLAEMSRNEVEEMYNNIEKEILEEKTDLIKINDVLQEASDKLEKAGGNRAQQFACTKIAEKRIPEAEMAVNEKNGETDFHLAFTPNHLLMGHINGLHGIGEVKRISRIKTNLYNVKESKDVNIKTDDDLQTCNVEDCCLTNDNQLLLTDLNNEKLKLIDLDKLTLVGVAKLNYAAFGVCSINEHEAVVTFNDNTIQFFSIHGNKMAGSRNFKMSHKCGGIATKDDKLYITDGESLHVYDMDCNLLKTITEDLTGNEIFAESNYITVADNVDKVYVSDLYNGIICLDDADMYQSSFNDDELDGVTGICADGRHNLFVVGYQSHNVIQFNENGKKIGVVVKQEDGLQHPYSVCFDKKRNILFVTMEESDTMKMFVLE